MNKYRRRLAVSDLTFGPLGRLLCTLVILFVPLCSILFAGPFGIVVALAWYGGLVHRALKDTWRPAAVPPTDLTRLQTQLDRERAEQERPRPPHPGLDAGASTPTRW